MSKYSDKSPEARGAEKQEYRLRRAKTRAIRKKFKCSANVAARIEPKIKLAPPQEASK